MFVYTETWFRDLKKHKGLEADLLDGIKLKNRTYNLSKCNIGNLKNSNLSVTELKREKRGKLNGFVMIL